MEGAVLRGARMLHLGLLTELIALLVLSACSPNGSPMAASDGATRPAGAIGAQRMLVMLGRLEPPSLAAKPFAADDFVFGWRVYATPELGASRSRPISLMRGVRAPDPRTVVTEWRQIYPDAASLDLAFQALPEHILGEPLEQLDPDAFVNLP